MTGRTAEAHSGPTDRVPPFRFSAVSRVDVAETDLGAVVYYGRYVHHVDRAVIAYRRHVGIPPLGPDGHLFVVRRLERIGGGPPGHLADAVITIVGVGGYEAPRPTRMPGAMRDAIAAFEGL